MGRSLLFEGFMDDMKWKSGSSSERDSDRLKRYQRELWEIRARLEAIAGDVELSPGTVKGLPKTFRSKSSWGKFAQAGRICSEVATSVAVVAGELGMGISLAEAAEGEE